MYIPILQCKSAEISALKELDDQTSSSIIPFMEMTGVEAKHTDKVKSFVKAWSKPFFLDVRPSYSDLRRSEKHDTFLLQSINQLPHDQFDNVIPVVYLNEDSFFLTRVGKLVKDMGLSACLRITAPELSRYEELEERVRQFLSFTNLTPSGIHVMYDYGTAVREFPPEALARNYRRSASIMTNLGTWQHHIIHSSSMPKDVTDFKAGQVYELDRLEVALWNELPAVRGADPIFSDRTITYPQIPMDERGFVPKASASVRYTTPTNVMLYRGYLLSNPDHGEYEQYKDHAKAIVSSPSIFSGQAFSKGDAKIHDYANVVKKNSRNTGNPASWLQALINHHLTLTAQQFS